MKNRIYPRPHDKQTVYLKNAITVPSIEVGNHSMKSLSAYTFPIFSDERKLDMKNICDAWGSNVDAVIRSDVRIGYEAVMWDGDKEKKQAQYSRHSVG